MAAEGELAEVGLGVEECNVRVEDAVEGFARGEEKLAGFEVVGDFLAEFGEFADGDGVEDFLLVVVKAVERADGEAGGIGDAAGGDLLEGDATEEGRGGVEDRIDGFVTAGLEGGAAGGGHGFDCKRECEFAFV